MLSNLSHFPRSPVSFSNFPEKATDVGNMDDILLLSNQLLIDGGSVRLSHTPRTGAWWLRAHTAPDEKEHQTPYRELSLSL
jgi:hypothetical protein